MADMASGLMKLLENSAPIGVAFYSTERAKQDFITRAGVLAGSRTVQLVHDGEAALAALVACDVLLVEPTDEAKVVMFFDRNRDLVMLHDKPTLIFLAQNGAGKSALANAPALASVVRATSFSVDTEITEEAATEIFIARHSTSYVEWLSKWRSGELADTTDNNLTLSEALAIEGDS